MRPPATSGLAAAVVCAVAAALSAPTAAAAAGSASRDGLYAGLDHAEAVAAANSNFPTVLREDPSPALPPAVDRVRGFAGARVALIDTGGHRGLLLSNAPLAAPDGGGTLRVLDLALEQRAGMWRPGRPVVSTVIDPDTGAFSLTSPGRAAVRVTPLEVAANAEGSVIEGKGFVSNSRTDVDTLLQATPTGLETFEQLRSSDAPTRLRWRLALPDGARPQRTPMGIVFRDSGGVPVLVVRAPWAVDAAGRDVPIGLGYGDGVLEMVVHHDEPGTTFPVLADPTWDASYDLRDPGVGTQGFFELMRRRGLPATSCPSMTRATAPGCSSIRVGAARIRTRRTARRCEGRSSSARRGRLGSSRRYGGVCATGSSSEIAGRR